MHLTIKSGRGGGTTTDSRMQINVAIHDPTTATKLKIKFLPPKADLIYLTALLLTMKKRMHLM